MTTTDQFQWKLHEVLTSEVQATELMHFYVEQVGYKAVKVSVEPGEQMTAYYLFVLQETK